MSTKVTPDMLAEEYAKKTVFPAVSGTGDAVLLTYSPPFTSYTSGMTLSFLVTSGNTGAVTVNTDGLGTKDLTKRGSLPLVSGDLLVGALLTIIYDGTRFQLASGTGAADLVIVGDVNALIGIALL